MYRFVLVNFPFTEGEGRKQRPALLVTGASYGKYKIVVVAYVTSRPGEGLESEVEVEKTTGSGLKRRSVIKLYKLASVSETAIEGELGVLSEEKAVEVREKLKKLLQIS